MLILQKNVFEFYSYAHCQVYLIDTILENSSSFVAVQWCSPGNIMYSIDVLH